MDTDTQQLILQDPTTPIPWRAGKPRTPFRVWRDSLGHLTNDAQQYHLRRDEILRVEAEMDAER